VVDKENRAHQTGESFGADEEKVKQLARAPLAGSRAESDRGSAC
jgi:hypothetical protein